MKKTFKIFKNGLGTGLFLQLAVGPVFFYIINLALQRSVYDGLIAALAVTLVDYIYITLSIAGVGKMLEKEKFKKTFGIISSVILIIFGMLIISEMLIIRSVTTYYISTTANITSVNLLSSFFSVFILTISNPMTILFNTSIYTAKAIEYNYTKKELYIFGFSVGLATFIFVSLSVIAFSLLRETIPTTLIQTLNLLVGITLIWYGAIRLIKIFKVQESK